ncbi:serine/threonine-protein kinase [Prosthecobacter sp.]|uniref:serine/threonine-protein kinase n=1 Tax=Prosthecobacter sp. TaxID=1965333 RepID=UPI003783E103
MTQESSPQQQPPFDVPSVEEMAALLPQYAFEKLAAYGGMGAVYKAKQESLDRPVAIKILPPEFGMQADFAERFKSEARAMAKLNHTHIVAVYDFGLTKEGHLYLVMEWVEGQTLHTMIQKGSVPVRKAANLAMQLCDALAFAHQHKILHRDIKPGNIMINEDEQVKVADFGLARPITGEAEENPFGTPDYAAPEILGRGAVDQRADIFAAGVVLYEMLTGRVPQQPRRSVTEFAPLSTRWDELINKATHPDTGQRFQEVGEFRAHIAMLINQSAQAVSVVAVVEDAPEARAGVKPLHLVLVGAAVLVTGLVLSGMFRGAPEPAPEKAANKEQLTAGQEAEVPEKQPKPKKKKEPEKKPEVVVVVPPTPEPETKPPPPPEAPAKTMTAAPPATAPVPANAPANATAPATVPGNEPATAATTAPAMKATPAPEVVVMPVPATPPPPETPAEAILRLEERDPELAKLVNDFGSEWAANDEIDTEPELKELEGKYIPALQRGLGGTTPEQRDFILSEISHVANHEPVDALDAAWPPVLKNLRKTYQVQVDAIEAQAKDAAHKMRAAQCDLVLQKASGLRAAGKEEAAKRAEAVAAVLAKLKAAPSLKALKETAAAPAGNAGAVPDMAAPPVR